LGFLYVFFLRSSGKGFRNGSAYDKPAFEAVFFKLFRKDRVKIGQKTV
jgi:hypothetical protein